MTATSAVASAASGGASTVALLPHSDRLRSELAFTALSRAAVKPQPPSRRPRSAALPQRRLAGTCRQPTIAASRPGSLLDRQAPAPVIGGMRLLLVAALVLMAGAAAA